MEAQLVRYAAAFPFTVAEQRQIEAIEEWLDVKLSRLLRLALTSIGEGNFQLTGEYFTIDVTGNVTQAVLDNMHLDSDPETAAQFGHVLCNYNVTGNELVIGQCDGGSYFVEDARATDPTVRCWIHSVGVVAAQRSLSSIIPKFRYFDCPQNIPQLTIDYEWFTRNVSLDLNPDRHYKKLLAWIKSGRPGMSLQYLGRSDQRGDPDDEGVSLFDPGYFLW